MKSIPTAYLTGDIIFFIIWGVLFFLRKDLRKKMLTMSLLIAPLGPLSEFFYLRDYWRPQLLFGFRIGVEDLLFAFTIGGISGVIYEELFGKKYIKRHLPAHRYWMLAFSLLGVGWMVLGNIFLGGIPFMFQR